MTRAFTILETVPASTKRNPSPVSGVVSAPTVHLTDLSILPLMPTSEEIRLQYLIKSPRRTFVTYIEGSLDIRHGDIMTVDTEDFKVVGVGGWPSEQAFMEIVLEDVVGT